MTDSTLAEAQERQLDNEPSRRATFMAWSIEDCVEGECSVRITTRSRTLAKLMEEMSKSPAEEADSNKEAVSRDPPDLEPDGPLLLVEVTDEDEGKEMEEIEQTEEYWGAHNPPPNIHSRLPA
jgi:hypothetical protein